jgi:putative redox protein
VPRSVARRREGYTHDVEVDGHELVVDEPESAGGAGLGPSPTRLLGASLASCTAITIEMYADRKGWDVGKLEVCVDWEYAKASLPASYEVTLKLPGDLTDEQRERLVVIAGKCPVHRVITHQTGVAVNDRVELV